MMMKQQQKAGGSCWITEGGNSYGYTPFTSKGELEGYARVTERIIQENMNALYAGVHLIVDDGQLSLSSSFRMDDLVDQNMLRLHLPHDQTVCSGFVKATVLSYLQTELPGTHLGHDDPVYKGHVLLDDDGFRVGAVCLMDTDATDREHLLKEVAAEVQKLLSDQRTLQSRKRSIECQINKAVAADDHVTEPLTSRPNPLNDERRALTSRRNSLTIQIKAQKGDSMLQQGDELARSVTVSDPSKTTRQQCRMQEINKNDLANDSERAHIPPSFDATLDAMRIKNKPPILKDDRERVASVESLGLVSIDPTGSLAHSLNKMVAMAARMFDADVGEITFQNHEKQFTLARHFASQEIMQTMMNFGEVLSKNENGRPFLCQSDRAMAICNYTVAKKRTLVVPDMEYDERFRYVYEAAGLRCYGGVPILSPDGHVMAVLCLLSSKACIDFSATQHMQLEQLAQMILQNIENWTLRRDIGRLEQEREAMTKRREKIGPPQNECTFIVTDVEGSTSLWELNPKAMQCALDIHDRIIRKFCAHYQGYEIDTEGDSFSLAFHDPVDAFGFALDTQTALYEADWPGEILAVSYGCDVPGSFRGLRVRMGVHSGQAMCRSNPVTGRCEYRGKAWNLAKNVEYMAHGGQILTTFETWNVASYMAESTLGSPQVLDLGSYVMQKGKRAYEGVATKQLIQLVPACLSFDYFAARCGPTEPEEERPECACSNASVHPGRRFPPLRSGQQVTLSFHDAPFEANQVTIAFFSASTNQTGSLQDDAENLAAVAKLVQKLLVGTTGYQCQNNMLAFPNMEDSIRFGLVLRNAIKEREALASGGGMALEGDLSMATTSNISSCLKYGALHGIFQSMGPHYTTGRADYFGKIVNRAARITSACEPGSVVCGIVASEHNKQATLPAASYFYTMKSIGHRELKGVQGRLDMFECTSTDQ